MKYDDKPWLKSYDEWVNPNLEIPDCNYVDLMEKGIEKIPDEIAYHFLGMSSTFKEFDVDSLKFANFYKNCGCKKGDKVGVCLPNTPQYLIAHTGAIRAGCAATGISPLMTPKEMAYQINDADVKALVILDALFEHRFLKIKDKVPNLTHVVVTNIVDFLPPIKQFMAKLLKKVPVGKMSEITGKTVVGFKEILKKEKADKFNVDITQQDICLIQYTGGTTGLPKGTELSHRNMVSNITQVTEWYDLNKGGETFCSAFPMFHQAGLIMYMGAVCSGNAQILIPDPRNTNHICEEMDKFRPAGMANVPSLYQMLLDNPNFKKLDFSNLRICISGAAPFAAESIRAFEAVVGDGKVVEAYGMTETSPIMASSPVTMPKKIGSVGLPMQNTIVKIISLEDNETEVPIGEEGEIITKGPQIMEGYYKKPEESDHALRAFQADRWLFSGDVGRMDDDGFIFIVDRAKDMLNVGGYKVFSREVEEKLYEVPAIEFCAIVGLPNQDRPGSEIVKLVVQLASDHKKRSHEEISNEITAFCKENMAPYKIPKIIEFTKEIPLTSVGKVDKKALR